MERRFFLSKWLVIQSPHATGFHSWYLLVRGPKFPDVSQFSTATWWGWAFRCFCITKALPNYIIGNEHPTYLIFYLSSPTACLLTTTFIYFSWTKYFLYSFYGDIFFIQHLYIVHLLLWSLYMKFLGYELTPVFNFQFSLRFRNYDGWVRWMTMHMFTHKTYSFI